MEDQRTLQVIGVRITPRGLCVEVEGIRLPGGYPTTRGMEGQDLTARCDSQGSGTAPRPPGKPSRDRREDDGAAADDDA